jgi:hypothetical protein
LKFGHTHADLPADAKKRVSWLDDIRHPARWR